MATTTITNNTRRDWLNGDQDFGADTINMALYNISGHGANTGAFTTVNEAAGTGYTTRGVAMSGGSISVDTANNVAFVDWTVNPSWATSTITATDCMIFQATGSSPTTDVANYIGDFSGSRSSSSGLFEVILPAPAFNTAVIRIA